MKSKSLKSRMIVAGAVWIFFALILAGSAISYMFIENVEKGVRSDLTATLSRLIAIIDLDAQQDRPRLTRQLPDPRYETPFSGVYWQITDVDNQQALRSRSLWDKNLQTGAKNTDGEHFASVQGPAGQSLLALSLTTTFKARNLERHYQIVVAQDRSILDETIRKFAWEMAAALTVLGASLVLAALFQVRFGLLPFRQLKSEVETIRKGAAFSLGSEYPTEVYPLVAEVNELLKLQETSIEFARARASDLAHGLKTPLSVLATIAYELENRGETSAASVLFDLSDEMNSRIDYQLKLSKLRQRARLHSLRAPLGSIVNRAVAVLKKTKEGEQLHWQIEMAQNIDVDLDENDLVELVGILLENAAKWATSKVHVSASMQDYVAELRVHDDGHGIGQSQSELIGKRGQRFDESVGGSGLGLAIAREILAINHGSITFESGQGMGTLVIVRLPLPV
ncbi:Signal transduction histidine kinase [Agrobacterium fabrum]|uniref:sensor histidine kinase n=1 Tax=Agrobacterium fabrum TaxID=1176649 RepID=UPI00088DA608|nr:HAMP domain-containing sensor histidine kinase [Agrobacterium fabrum]SDB72892.1 Signal transduction histidine kinase [Agrobacterium fabrum]SES09662.1 Signal transduction histidine kinase [Agrobacterium fabrum]